MVWAKKMITHFQGEKVDRHQEILEIWEAQKAEDMKLLRLSVIGSVGYGAVQNTKTEEVKALIVVTSVTSNTLNYKFVDESEIPHCYECPLPVLRLLSKTDDPNANEWRKRCMDKKKERRLKHNLIKFSLGTVIAFVNEMEIYARSGTYVKHKGDIIRLIKKDVFPYGISWCEITEKGELIRWKSKAIPANYYVVSKP